jgi:diguanylate cyclase (GGDEF)-like protein
LKAQGNQYTWWNCHLLLYSDERGDICGIVFFKDIDEQKQNTLMLQHYAERDLFTGLYNKATTQTQITKVLTQNNDKESIHGIMVLDIDDFKNINDTMGHIAGDIVLKKIANDMKDTFRKSDIIGRTGGDEFMVCMKDILDIGNVTYKAEELLKKIRSYELYMENGKKVEISVSIGIALYPQQGNTFQELYQKADRALYHSKRCGKNQYFIYDSLLE